MKFTAKSFKKRLSRKRKQRRQRTRRLKKQRGGSTIPNTNPSLEDLQKEGAVFANPEKVEEYGPEDIISKA